MISPIKILLPQLTQDYGRVRTIKPQNFKKQEYVVVPFISQLKVLLSMDDVYEKMFSDKFKSPDLLSHFEDCFSYLENHLFQPQPHAIQIHL
jgi:hypothetical protein